MRVQAMVAAGMISAMAAWMSASVTCPAIIARLAYSIRPPPQPPADAFQPAVPWRRGQGLSGTGLQLLHQRRGIVRRGCIVG